MPAMPDPTGHQLTQLRSDLFGLTIAFAHEVAGDVHPDGAPLTEREVRLAVLAATRIMRAELEKQLTLAATEAAAAGADYTDVAEAAGLRSRQAARHRWPDLAALTRAARGRAQ